MATLKLEIVTPEAKAYSEDVEMVVIPGASGERGILPMHEPMMIQIVPGALKVTKSGKEIFLAVGEGFAEVTQEHVTILADMAIEESSIDEDAAQAAVARAEEAMKNKELGGEEVAAVQASLQKSLAQLRVKRRHHPR